MSTRITGTDLNQWSGLRTTLGTLPAVVRELIMATVEPTRIRFPADEAVPKPRLARAASGGIHGSAPDPGAMHQWVQQVREALAKRNRAGIASLAIGEALAGRA